MKFILILILLAANQFSTPKSYALDVNDYYQNTNKEYFYFFLKKLFNDPEFSALQQEIKKNSSFAKFFEIWLQQVDSWSFKNNDKTVYMFQILYQIEGELRVPMFITFNFKNNSSLKDALKMSGLNLSQSETDIGLNLNFKSAKLVTGQAQLSESLEMQEFDEFPYYLFIKKNNLLDFFFTNWRIPVDKLIFKENQTWGFAVP